MTEPQRLHAVLSPSGAKAWMTCARKPLMEKGMPDDGNEYSDEGTCAHAVAALCLTEGEPATEYVGRVFDVGGGRKYEFRDDMVEPVQVYVDLVRAYHRSLPGSELHVEVKVPISRVTGEEGATGTADAVIVGLDELICCDLKFGMGVEVSAVENPQAMLYGGGALEVFDPTNSIERLRCVIIQPRLSAKPSEWDCTVEQLRQFEGVASNAAALALSIYNGTDGAAGDRFGLNPSEDACKFCKAKSKCPALADFVVDAVGTGFMNLDAKVSEDAAVAALVPSELEDVGRKFRAIPMIEMFCKAVRAQAESLLFASNNSPEAQAALGIKIVQGKQGNRKWSDDLKAEALFKQFRLKQEDMYSFTLLSPTAMEKFIKKNGKRGWLEKMAALTTREPGKPSVAPLDDPRPALDVTPTAEGFDKIPDDGDTSTEDRHAELAAEEESLG